MAKGERGWLRGLGEIVDAVRSDPWLLAPAAVVIGLAVLLAYLGWRFL